MQEVELNHLIKMLNQLADNLAQGDSPEITAERVADHLRRFWAPGMKKCIGQYANTGGEGLSPVARQAVNLIS